MFHVEQYKMFHVEQCKINVTRGTMHKGSSLGGRGQRRASAAAFRSSRRGFGCFGLRWARVAAARRASSALRSWACSASVGGGQLRFASPPSAILRLAIPVAPFAYALLASAQPRRSALRCLHHCLPPLQAAAGARSIRSRTDWSGKLPPELRLRPPRGLAPMLPPPADCPDC